MLLGSASFPGAPPTRLEPFAGNSTPNSMMSFFAASSGCIDGPLPLPA